MKLQAFAVCAFLCAALLPQQVVADHAFAMHGAPLYPEGYTHFDYASPGAPKGGVLRLSKTGTFNNLNPVIITGNKAEGLELLFEPLMRRAWNEPFTMYGLIAESVDVAPDRSWVEFHLNPAARFHDGTPITAEDVKFSFDMFREHGHPVRRRVYGLVDKVDIQNPHTIRFEFGEGYDRESVMIVMLMQVLPQKYWTAEGRDITKTTVTPPMGSGPYKIEKLEPGREIVYSRVQDYWAKDLPVNRGHYNFDTVSYTYFRDDGVALEAFGAGEYDIRHEYNIGKWRTAYNEDAVKAGKTIKENIVHGRPEWLRALIFNTRRSMFHDIRVRRALGMVFNYAWLNKTIYYGAYKPLDSSFSNSYLKPEGTPSSEELALLKPFADTLPPEVFGPAWAPPGDDARENRRAAVVLLKDAGWQYKDGQLVDAKGAPMTIEILLDSPNDEKIVLEYVRTLKKMGIAARVRTVDSAQFTGRLQDFDYDMIAYKWINSLSPGAEQLNYWGSAAADMPGSRNYPGVKNPAIDALAASIAQSETREELITRVHALDRVLMWGHYFVPLFYSGKDMVAYTAELERPAKTPVYGTVLETWYKKAGK
ncbi:MAG: extracellular solute-binding protein [Alphaproteobacteria bacterium]|nr:extracellular solute-binding protein [Alphaproteobacteria bacterium]